MPAAKISLSQLNVFIASMGKCTNVFTFAPIGSIIAYPIHAAMRGTNTTFTNNPKILPAMLTNSYVIECRGFEQHQEDKPHVE